MATWFEITYTGEPTEADYARVAELAAQGFTSGQLINYEVCTYCSNDIAPDGAGGWAMVPVIRAGEHCNFASDGRHEPKRG
jgi:hypothetical protein